MRGSAGQRAIWGAAGLLMLAVGCGDSDTVAVRPSGAAMARTAPSASAAESNRPPVVTSVRLSPRDPVPGVPISVAAEVSDPDDDPVRIAYRWLLNGREVVKGARPSALLPGLEKGDRLEVEVTATDGRDQSEPRRVRARVANRPPVVDGIDFGDASRVRAGDSLEATPLARDPDGDALRFRYTWYVNDAERSHERTLSTRGLHRGDRLRVRVVALDGEAESRPLESRELLLGNTPPRITQLPELETDSGVFRYHFQAVDADGDRNLRFWLEQAPKGMTIDSITGDVVWRPEATQVGVHPVEVGVKDSQGEGSTFLFDVTVIDRRRKSNLTVLVIALDDHAARS